MIKNFIYKIADKLTGGSDRRFFIFYMLPFLICIMNGYFILAGVMFVLFVGIIMGSLTLKYQDAKYDCLPDDEKKKIEREKKLKNILR